MLHIISLSKLSKVDVALFTKGDDLILWQCALLSDKQQSLLLPRLASVIGTHINIMVIENEAAHLIDEIKNTVRLINYQQWLELSIKHTQLHSQT